jgi:hypothetical protein
LVSAKGQTPEDPAWPSFWRRLSTLEGDLRRIERDLRGRLSWLEHQRGGLWSVPRDQRYSARQSIDDREVVTQDLLAEAASILNDLLALGYDVRAMRPGDWESVFQDLTKFGVDHAFFHAVVQQLPKGRAILNPAPLVFTPADFAPLIGLMAAIISNRLRRRS